MRIAQVAPLIESVPPKHYGGTERIVSYLTEELVRAGHHVTLFASGDSVTSAELVPVCRRSFRQNKRATDYLSREVLLMDHVMQRAGEFDVIHFHTGCLHYLISRHVTVPHVTTLHGRLDTPELLRLYERFRDMPMISISNSQRTPWPCANWQGTIYHGLPKDLFRFHPEPGKDLDIWRYSFAETSSSMKPSQARIHNNRWCPERCRWWWRCGQDDDRVGSPAPACARSRLLLRSGTTSLCSSARCSSLDSAGRVHDAARILSLQRPYVGGHQADGACATLNRRLIFVLSGLL